MQELLLPQLLKPAGYVCGAVGKWHLGFASNFHPTNRGFDEFFGFLGWGSKNYNAPLLRNTTHLTETTYLTDAFTREGVSFINRHGTQPFFLYLAYNAVHKPYDTPPAQYMDRVATILDPDRRKYAAMVTALDDGVGQVLQALRAQNILQKTCIVFLSDNGATDQPFTRNTPLRGYKENVLEGGIHVPFAVQWTGQLRPGTRYDAPVSSLDILATAVAAAGVSLPTDRVYDGMNVLPYLAGEQVGPQRSLFWRWFGLGQDGPPGSLDTIWAVRSGPLKLVTSTATAAAGKPPELYNLSADIGEAQNLALARPGDVQSLKQLYNSWNAQTVSPRWLGDGFASKIIKLVLAGDWNAYNRTDSVSPWRMKRIVAPGVDGTPDGFDWLTNTIHVATVRGDTTPGAHSFVLVGSGNYSQQWGGATINIDGVTSVPFFSRRALAPVNTISLQDGYYYSCRILDWNRQIGRSMKLSVMKTSAPPISLTQVAQTPTAPTSIDSVVVSVVTSQPKSIEERIYLRWSTDFFVTSHVAEARGSGANFSATIPPQAAGTAVQYCIVTSTVDLLPFVTSGVIDGLTLASSKTFTVVTGDETSGDLSVADEPEAAPFGSLAVSP